MRNKITNNNYILKSELRSLGSNYQLCLGQKRGIENAIHKLRDQCRKNSADAVLSIDAENLMPQVDASGCTTPYSFFHRPRRT